MARISVLTLAQSKIEQYLSDLDKNVFLETDQKSIFNRNKKKWDLTYSTTFEKFVNHLLKRSYLSFIEVPEFNKIIYIWKENTLTDEAVYEVALAIKPRSYISHYSAMFLLNLTEQIPKTIYVTYDRESPINKRKNIDLLQGSIDCAFSKEKKKPRVVASFKGYDIVLISGTDSKKTGVTNIKLFNGITIQVTNIARTLIDIVVRPELSGDVTEIAKAYSLAKNQVQIKQLKTYIKSKDYIYPYEQVVGFLMEYVGYDADKVEEIHGMCKNIFSFYLGRNIKNPLFSEKWKIYYPKLLDNASIDD